MKHCKKCRTSENITKHHVKPLCHFGSRRTNRETVYLCRHCHDTIETGILFLEARIGGVTFGTRYKLHESEYEYILKLYLNKK